MAILARRTWANLRDEAILRLGNILAAGFSGRVERALEAALFELATTVQHYELMVEDTTSITLSTSVNSVSLPADCFSVASLRLRNAAGTSYVGSVGPNDYTALMRAYGAAPGQPSRYARWAGKLYFDYLPSSAFKGDLAYYKLPTAPDFASGSPELGRDCDEPLLNLGLAVMWAAIGRPDLAEVSRGLYEAWVKTQVRPLIQEGLVPGLRERPVTHTTAGGAQG